MFCDLEELSVVGTRSANDNEFQEDSSSKIKDEALGRLHQVASNARFRTEVRGFLAERVNHHITETKRNLKII